MTTLYNRLAALTPLLLALTVQAQNAPPAAVAEQTDKLAQNKPAQLLQDEPTAAGTRASAPLTRAAVISELRRARSTGEMDRADRETTGFMH
ncbi:MAG: hypothetical protein ACOVLH_03700 [Roseateles sp.]